jgi:hypothetical protein
MKLAFRIAFMVLIAITFSVPAYTSGLEITSITVNANQSNHNGPCPDHIVFTAWVTVQAPENGDVFNYRWTRSDGAKGPVTVERLHKGTNRVRIVETWTMGATGSQYIVWEELHVNSGNIHMSQRSADIQVNCR